MPRIALSLRAKRPFTRGYLAVGNTRVPVTFLIDTGSTRSIITKQAAQTLFPKTHAINKVSVMRVGNNQLMTMPLVRLRISIGDKIRTTTVAVTNLPRAQCVLGYHDIVRMGLNLITK